MGERTSPASASSRARASTPRGTHFQRVKSNSRPFPGAMRRIYSAASMGMVPLPQKTSAKGFPARKKELSTSAAAVVSRRGAP